MVTFLFTDVEGSTRRWEADAEGMRAALAAHDEVLRSAIGAHGGCLFKHTGDGVCASFASPRSAVDAAVAAQRARELPVRMGIATGEAELREGDYFGAVLNRAARVMAAGHGGQVLLAESTAGLLTGVDLVDLGPRRLRDLPIRVPALAFRGTSPGNARSPAELGQEQATSIPSNLDGHPGRSRDAGTGASRPAKPRCRRDADRLATMSGPSRERGACRSATLKSYDEKAATGERRPRYGDCIGFH